MVIFRPQKDLRSKIFISTQFLSPPTTVGRGYVIGFVCLYICLSVFQHESCKGYQPILSKLEFMIGPSCRKNGLTFGRDPIPHPGYRFRITFSMQNRAVR